MPTSLDDPAVRAALRPHPRTLTVAGATFPTPFPSPADWRDVWIYFLLVDRFNDPLAPPRHPPWDALEERHQGGTFEGIRSKLAYLKQLGVGALWLSPVLKNPPSFEKFWGGYAIQDFLAIEPRFCRDPAAARANPALADAELRALVDEAHAAGLWVILDVVLNHAGDLFDYEGMRAEAPWNAGGEYRVFWRDPAGVPVGAWTDIAQVQPLPRDAGVWPVELQRNDTFRRRGTHAPGAPETMGDFGTLKELATDRRDAARDVYPVRDVLIRACQYLIGAFDVDGFRIDTLKYVEPDFAHAFGNAMREYALSIGKRNFFTFGEVWEEHDERRIAAFIGRNTLEGGETVGVDAALDFPVFHRLRRVCKGDDPPTALAEWFAHRRTVQQPIVSSHGDASRFFVTFLDNHDLHDRCYFRDAHGTYDAQHTLALTCLFTVQGIPCVYYGTEQGLHGRGDRREAVREALWGKPNAFDPTHPFFRTIRDLAALRAAQPALRYGRQYFRELSGDGVHFGPSIHRPGVLAFSRILNDQEVLVVANTHTTQPTGPLFVTVDRHLHPAGRRFAVAFANLPGPRPPGPVAVHGGRATVGVDLRPMEAQVLT